MGALSVLAAGLSLLILVLTLRTARSVSRVSDRSDVLKIIVGGGGALVMGAIAGTSTPVAAMVGAVAAGGALGWYQGQQIDMGVRDGKVVARRTALGAGLWAGGLIAMQVAGLGSRVQVFKVGQAIAIFSVAVTAGLIAGRRPTLLETKAIAKGGAVVAVIAGVLTLVGSVDATALPILAQCCGEAHFSDGSIALNTVVGVGVMLAYMSLYLRDSGQELREIVPDEWQERLTKAVQANGGTESGQAKATMMPPEVEAPSEPAGQPEATAMLASPPDAPSEPLAPPTDEPVPSVVVEPPATSGLPDPPEGSFDGFEPVDVADGVETAGLDGVAPSLDAIVDGDESLADIGGQVFEVTKGAVDVARASHDDEDPGWFEPLAGPSVEKDQAE